MSKARCDSKLKSMAAASEEFGAKLWEWCHAEKTADCPGGYKHARAQLLLDGIELGGGWLRQLSAFCSWWAIRRETSQTEQFSQDMAEMVAKKLPGMSAEQIAELQELFFTMQAANSGNVEEWREMQYLNLARKTAKTRGRQKEEELRLKREKFERETCSLFLRWRKDKRAEEIAESGMSNSQKIAALRESFFKDVDELEKSGDVQLPEAPEA